MVNVNKNIKLGVKAEHAAPKRRLRNHALNSSKKSIPDSIRSRRHQKLNCSRESVLNQLVNEEQIYTQEEAKELIDSFEEQTGAAIERLATQEEVENQDGEFWATKNGKTTLWCRGNGMWYDSGITDVNSSKKTRMNCSRWDWDAWDEYGTPADVTPSIQTAVDGYGEGLVVDKVLTPTGGIGKYLNKQGITQLIFIYDGEDRDSYEEIVGWDGTKIIDDFTPYNLADIRDKAVESGFDLDSSKKRRMNCSADTKITTESGNEVSMSEVKVVQNPSTNELALFIPENDEDTIPEGFTVIGDVVSAGGEEAENSEEDEYEESEELDSSKKLNSSKRRSSKNLNSNIRRSAKKKK